MDYFLLPTTAVLLSETHGCPTHWRRQDGDSEPFLLPILSSLLETFNGPKVITDVTDLEMSPTCSHI